MRAEPTESMTNVQPLILGSGEVRSLPLHKARLARRLSLELEFCAFAGAADHQQNDDRRHDVYGTFPCKRSHIRLTDVCTSGRRSRSSKPMLHGRIWTAPGPRLLER